VTPAAVLLPSVPVDGRVVADRTRLAGFVRERAQALEALYRLIAASRMDGVPILHPRLEVAAVGFEADADGRGASGVLVTPWFMNLVWLPLPPQAARGADLTAPDEDAPVSASGQPVAAPAPLGLGCTRERQIGHTTFPFIGSGEAPFGPFEACSLFSPMFEFEDHAAALATARAVLDHLRAGAPGAGALAATGAPPCTAPATSDPAAVAAPSRRRLLFGAARTPQASPAR
jgi:hypothetical protein